MAPILNLACSVAALLFVIGGISWMFGASSSAKYLQAALFLSIVLPVVLAMAGPAMAELDGWWRKHAGDVKVTSLALGLALLIGLHVFLVRRATHRRPENLSLKKRVE